MKTFVLINPSTEEELVALPAHGARDVDAAVCDARSTQPVWAATAAADRGRILHQVSELIRRDAGDLAVTECLDTGKPLRQARADVALAARYFEFYAGAADKLHGETIPFQPGHLVYTRREPHGVTGHILPWNYPLQMAARTLAPALAVGNAVVLKPAEDACWSVVKLFELFREAGLPEGVANLVTGLGQEAGAALADHPGIDFLSFTGSPEVGSAVMAACAHHNRPLTLELGGKSPQILFEDADLEAALPVVVSAITQNGGQTCSAGSRVLVHESLADRVEDYLIGRFSALTVGVAMQDPDVGPLISARQRDRVSSMIAEAVMAGAVMAARSRIPTGRGYFVPPTLLTHASPESVIQQTEVFGPVLTLTRFSAEEDAVALANGTPYGLTTGVWTRDLGRAHRMAEQIRAGQVFVNTYGAGGGVELPFGGVKRSGFGREKGLAALHDMTVLKTVVIRH